MAPVTRNIGSGFLFFSTRAVTPPNTHSHPQSDLYTVPYSVPRTVSLLIIFAERKVQSGTADSYYLVVSREPHLLLILIVPNEYSAKCV